MEINFDEYKVRSYTHSDISSLVKYANNYNISRWLKDSFPFPYTEEEAVVWLATCSSQQPETCFAIADSNELIGGIGFHIREDVFRFNAEIGYWLGEPFWGKNIVSRAVKEMTHFIFTNFNINRIYANVFDGNPASAKVLTKCGYRREAVLIKSVFKENKFIDQHIYALLREEFNTIE